jgi:hypothetical protein
MSSLGIHVLSWVLDALARPRVLNVNISCPRSTYSGARTIRWFNVTSPIFTGVQTLVGILMMLRVYADEQL